MIYFVDTSALVKRYVDETGSGYVRNLVTVADHVFYQSFLSPLEISSAFYRRHRMGELSSEELTLALQAYVDHSHKEYILIPYSEALLNTAGTLLARYPLRTLDAIQFAAALSLRISLAEAALSLMFLSADERLLGIARQEQLLTDNPNDHP